MSFIMETQGFSQILSYINNKRREIIDELFVYRIKINMRKVVLSLLEHFSKIYNKSHTYLGAILLTCFDKEYQMTKIGGERGI